MKYEAIKTLINSRTSLCVKRIEVCSLPQKDTYTGIKKSVIFANALVCEDYHRSGRLHSDAVRLYGRHSHILATIESRRGKILPEVDVI